MSWKLLPQRLAKERHQTCLTFVLLCDFPWPLRTSRRVRTCHLSSVWRDKSCEHGMIGFPGFPCLGCSTTASVRASSLHEPPPDSTPCSCGLCLCVKRVALFARSIRQHLLCTVCTHAIRASYNQLYHNQPLYIGIYLIIFVCQNCT